MRKWLFTFVAYDETQNFMVEVREDELGGEVSSQKLFLVGTGKLPKIQPPSWKTWRIEEIEPAAAQVD